jgi:hypothetical protein
MSDQERLFPDDGPAGPAGRAKRERDPLWDALCFVCKINPQHLTISGRGMLNRALKEIRDAGGTPPDVLHRAQAYQERFSGVPTPGALARHWASLETRPRAVRKVEPAPEPETTKFLDRQELARRAREYRQMLT